MRLGIAYNMFDSLELLEASIDTVSSVADFICVVYQEVSNFGELMSDRDRRFLEELNASGKVDLFYEYEPDVGRGGHMNELVKRNLGKNLCCDNGCTHFMSMDTDEFYDPTQLQFAYDTIVDGSYESCAFKMMTYWKTSKFVLDPPEQYYVSGIYTLDEREFSMRHRWPVPVDPTRRLDVGRLRIFERSEIQMHHMSYCRSDLRLKLRNSSASVNFKNRIEKIAAYYDNWTVGQPAYLAGLEERYHDVKEVEDKFNLKL